MTRKIGRGTLLTEMVKGSYNYTLSVIRGAFYKKFGYESGYIGEVFADYLIVDGDDLAPDEFYLVRYSRGEGDGYAFAGRSDWETVELTYQPVRMEESRSGQMQQFVERVSGVELLEATEGGERRIAATVLTADVVNGNGRRYPRHVVQEAVAALQKQMAESTLPGYDRTQVLGEAEHPSAKVAKRPNLLETVVRWDDVGFDGQHVTATGALIPTSKGRDVITLAEHGVRLGVSIRGVGRSVMLREGDVQVEEVTGLAFRAFDLVDFAEKSDPDAGAIVESVQDARGGDEMGLDEILALLQEKPEMAEAVMRRMGLADRKALAESLGVEPGKLEEAIGQAKEAQGELERRTQAEAVEEAIAEATKDLAYGKALNGVFVEAVRAAQPETPEDVRALVTAKRSEYDAIAAGRKLAGMGFEEAAPRGPVLDSVRTGFEEATGLPEYVRPSREFTERLAERGYAQVRDLGKATSQSGLFARRYLEAYDRAYRRQLEREARLVREMEEAETTTDLNLPYSVGRSIVAEAVPQLVALSVFDAGLADSSPTRVYYENYSAEGGAQPSVTDESVTSGEGAWVDLANARLQAGTVVVTSDPAGTTYTEYTDYLVDYANGKLYTLASGSIGDATALLVDYTYDLTRGGEMAAIQRGKAQLTYQTIELAADRLAQQISDEAVTFARTQLGWDATGRTLAMIIREIREMIDSGLMRLGIAQAHIAGNSGGTWNSASDPLSELVEKIGVAKVSVMNDYYMPTAVLMSVTNADRLSNWDGYTAMNARVDASQAGALGAGDTGLRVKSLAVFASTEMPDAKILVVNRELVQYRVLEGKPMTVKGPFPSYSSDKLVAAEQYYVEEYNATVSMIANKGAYVTVS